jgi:hypothetical protein
MYFDKMVAESDGKIDMKIVLRDENERINEFVLTNKAKSIQTCCINKETGGALAHWGPRPKEPLI